MAGKQKGHAVARMYMTHELVWLSAISRYVHPGDLVDLQHVPQDEIDALLGAGVVVAVELDSPQDPAEPGSHDDVMALADDQPVIDGRSSTSQTLQKE